MRRWSLRTRVATLAALLVLGLAAAIALTLPARLAQVSMAWAKSRALTVGRVVASGFEPSLAGRDVAGAEALLARLGASAGALGASLLEPGGAPLATWGTHPVGPLAGPGDEAVDGSLERIRVRVPVPVAGGAPGTLVLDVSPAELRARAAEMRRVLLVALLTALVAGVLVAGAIGEFTARPLQRMTSVARRIAQGDLSARADLDRKGGAEAWALADALDAMLQRLYGQQALLAERARAIAGMNAQLEERVAERTAELEAANGALGERLEELRRTQEQLIVADRRVAVGRLAAGVAHEINNPLACVASNLRSVQRALDGLALDLPAGGDRPGSSAAGEEIADARAAVKDALDGADRVREIVRGLRTFSRGDEDAREVLALAEPLAAAIAMAQHEIRARARLEQALGPTPAVHASPIRLSQVFLNLLVNAAQAIPAGADPAAHRIRVTTATAGDGWARIEISDTGAGIAPEHVGRVFDPFFTTKQVGEGTGLGLSISQGIVTAAGGRISCTSAPGEGTTFVVLLPPVSFAAASAAAARAASASVTSAAAAPPPPARPRGAVRPARVLVVDDEPLVANAVRRALRGHDVQLQASGEAALDVLRRGERFDRILCDVTMPGMDGFTFADAVAALDPAQGARLTFMTGGAFAERTAALLEAQPDRVLEKPLDLGRLRALVEVAGA